MSSLQEIKGQVLLAKAPTSVIRAVQVELKRLNLYQGTINGIADKPTIAAFHAFKQQNYLGDIDTLGATTAQKLLTAKPQSKFLTSSDYAMAAKLLKVDIAVIRAVVEVEATGTGFLPNGKPKILFEAHHFAAETKGKYNATHPSISSSRWNPKLYKGGMPEWERFDLAAALNRKAAIRSTSFGAFQILGSNCTDCGYKNEEDFYQKMFVSEAEHLKAFCGFVEANKLTDELRRKDFAAFSRGYNGPLYWKHQYDIRLAKACAKYAIA